MSSIQRTIVDEWAAIQAPPPPELKPVTVDLAATALLILDMQKQNCSAETRPRCVATISAIRVLLDKARKNGVPVIYSLTRQANENDVRAELTPLPGEPVVASGVDKFFATDLENILRARGIETVILVGTSAHGAVLHTATGAALRGFMVIVPIDGISADEPYAEQYTAWHLANSPGTRRHATVTRSGLISFG